MKEFEHPHIIKLIGVLETSGDTLAIVMELAKFGQLRAYLQHNRNQLETRMLILYCVQINSALAYLEARNYVHR